MLGALFAPPPRVVEAPPLRVVEALPAPVPTFVALHATDGAFTVDRAEAGPQPVELPDTDDPVVAALDALRERGLTPHQIADRAVQSWVGARSDWDRRRLLAGLGRVVALAGSDDPSWGWLAEAPASSTIKSA